ncbi:hypothetical protein PAG33_13250, partial [Klebsiella quasipneumoniae]|uniref:hypothetical protein n=1 Tax=Klebsiella quasipneumoniae TaxID=1463165 RepID=UPI00284A7358
NKAAYCLKIQPATGSFARNLIYSTKPQLLCKKSVSIPYKPMPSTPVKHSVGLYVATAER